MWDRKVTGEWEALGANPDPGAPRELRETRA